MALINLIASIVSFALHVKTLVSIDLFPKTQYEILLGFVLFLGQFLAVGYIILKFNKLIYLRGRKKVWRFISDSLSLWVKIPLFVLIFYGSVIASIGTQMRINTSLDSSLRNYWEPRIVSITSVIIYAVTATVAHICQTRRI
jgi:hypothetical protein